MFIKMQRPFLIDYNFWTLQTPKNILTKFAQKNQSKNLLLLLFLLASKQEKEVHLKFILVWTE